MDLAHISADRVRFQVEKISRSWTTIGMESLTLMESGIGNQQKVSSENGACASHLTQLTIGACNH
jgi:hypothetical protein